MPLKSFQQIFESSSPVFSFEFFPPKKETKLGETRQVMERICDLQPDFMTVTYGAGGGTRAYTRELTGFIARELQVPSVAHLTCVGHTAEEIDGVLDSFLDIGVSHVLALRGDPPKGQDTFQQVENGFGCARDLASHIKKRNDFSIAVAGYPEIHPDAESRESDLRYLAEKIDAGAEIVITQLFFDADVYFEFVRDAKSYGIHVPIIPGIMPISNVSQLKRFTTMCGASIPERISKDLEECQEDDAAVVRYGTDVAIDICRKLLQGGAPGVHFYTINKNQQVEEVCRGLSDLR